MSAQTEKQEILLESGTNELEVLVFSLGPTRYGVNVAKVREVLAHVEVVEIPMTNPSVVGVFNLRNTVIPLVDLQLYFQPGVPSQAEQRTVILMEFNNRQIGFLVDGVERIFRISWNAVRSVPTLQKYADSVITSVCDLDGGLVLMVDFEKIAFDISDETEGFKGAEIPQEETQAADPLDDDTPTPRSRGEERILLAEDSPTIRNAITSALRQAGYGAVVDTQDGLQAWEAAQTSLETGAEPFTIIVTDIEMPQMDGLHLCKRIKEHPELKRLPVIVFSSLVSDTNLKKCEAVGADAAITKPQMTELVALIDELLARYAGSNAGQAEPALV